jgi:hypothetical protein
MAMGYQGLAQIGSQSLPSAGIDGGYINLLITGCAINMALDPIYSAAVWGAGWFNGAATANYADNVVRFEGGMDFELQASKNVWNLVRDWAIESRAYSRAARITPDGSWIYNYTASGSADPAQNPTDPGTYTNAATIRRGLWSRGLTLNTSEGAFVTAAMDCLALERDVYGPGDPRAFSGIIVDPALTTITDPGAVSYIQDKFGLSNPNNPLNPGGLSYDPIPYWRTEAYIKLYNGATWSRVAIGPAGHQIDTETVEWSVDLANNTFLLFTCRGVRGASAVLQGAIDCTGSVTLYNPYGVFDPVFGAPGVTSNGTTWTPGGGSPFSLNSPCFYAAVTELVVRIAGANVAIVVPAVVLEADDYGVRAQGDVTNRVFTIKGLGGRYWKPAGAPANAIPFDSDFTNPASPLYYEPNDMSPGHPLPSNVALPPMLMTKAS